jgi:hypothetical protein
MLCLLGRPIGAVVFLQRGMLKVCLRTADNATNTSEVAKVHRFFLFVSVDPHGFRRILVFSCLHVDTLLKLRHMVEVESQAQVLSR